MRSKNKKQQEMDKNLRQIEDKLDELWSQTLTLIRHCATKLRVARARAIVSEQ